MDNKTLSPAEITEIRARVDAATPGDWEWWEDKGVSMLYGDASSRLPPVILRTEPEFAPEPHDREFIAHARTDIPALLDALATAEQENERLRGVIELCVGHTESLCETQDAYDPRHYGVQIAAQIKDLSDSLCLDFCGGAAWIDDPPKGWTRKQLAQYARGVLTGEAKAAGNMDSIRRVHRWLTEALAPPLRTEAGGEGKAALQLACTRVKHDNDDHLPDFTPDMWVERFVDEAAMVRDAALPATPAEPEHEAQATEKAHVKIPTEKVGTLLAAEGLPDGWEWQGAQGTFRLFDKNGGQRAVVRYMWNGLGKWQWWTTDDSTNGEIVIGIELAKSAALAAALSLESKGGGE